jgi:hypothetical protein
MQLTVIKILSMVTPLTPAALVVLVSVSDKLFSISTKAFKAPF